MIFDMLNRLKSVVYLPGDFVCKKVSNMALFFFFSFFTVHVLCYWLAKTFQNLSIWPYMKVVLVKVTSNSHHERAFYLSAF